MLTREGFELAPSGYRSSALPVELSSPQGLEASFIQFKCTRYSRDNLTLSMKMDVQCLNSNSESSSGYYETITLQLTYTAEVNCKMLTRAGFELAHSGYRSSALPDEISSPQGLEASFYPI